MQLTWKASASASALHAAHALARGCMLASPGLGDALGPLVSVPPVAARGDLPGLLGSLLQHAASGVEHNPELAERTLTKLWGQCGATAADTSALAAWVGCVEQAYFEWHRGVSNRQLVDEIVTRTSPLHDQWQARGPGMMREVGRLTEAWVVAERADVVMVLPVVGGDGMAHLPANLVTIEAMLANADERLPEVLRLAWLLAQLQFDLPAIAEQVSPGKLARLAALAMLPPVLSAGERVELTADTPEMLTHALVAWQVASSAHHAERLAGHLQQWWATYQGTDITWPAAVAALEVMVGE